MNGDTINEQSRKAISNAQVNHLGVYVSPITAWEIATLAAKNRLNLTISPEIWFESLLELPGIRLAELSPQILIASATLPGTPPSDPADRIIAATGRTLGYSIITRDAKIIGYGQQGNADVIAC